MAKPTLYLLVGLPHAGVPELTTALDEHRDALAAVGIRIPARSDDEMFRAAVEIRREHRAWGLRRKDVEGTWSALARRATRKLAKDDRVVLGHDLLAGATSDQIALLLDALSGTAVHVVVVAGAPDPLAGLVPDELDLAEVVARWGGAVKSPDRLHVLAADPDRPAAVWAALAALVGFDATTLLMRSGAAAHRLDAGTLRLLSASTYAVLGPDELVDLGERWAKVVADHGYDVRGDLRGLLEDAALASTSGGPTDPSRAIEQVRVDVLRAALGEALAEVGRLREQTR